VKPGVGSARLAARPEAPTAPSSTTGELPLLDETQASRGVLLVPQSYRPGRAAPLVVLLHGAGGTAEDILDLMREEAEDRGALLVVPKSVGRSWDLMARGDFGPDIERLDAALERVFREYSVDAGLIGISGFSDGASYALSVGLSNGDLFSGIAAFSPGFVAASELRGKPGVFISHGTQDAVLPIDSGGRYIHGQLEHEGYTVVYREFEGPHTVPSEVARDGFIFLAHTLLP
jgi:phospholipase/carboxylesterase